MTKSRYGIGVWLLAILLLVSFVLVPDGQAWANEVDEQVLSEVRKHLEEDFVYPVEADVLKKTSVQDMVDSLNDPYSVYFSPEEYESFLVSTDQNFSGVGMQVEFKEDYVTVVSPIKNTPAARAGIKSGDKILTVNGENVVGKPLDHVVSLLRGEAGTSVTVTVERQGEVEPLVFMLARENIHMEAVESEILESGIGYIALSSFSPEADDEFEAALADLKAQGMQGLVFDLRNNPGGYLTTGLRVAAEFAAQGQELLHVVSRDGKKDSYQSLSPALDIPTVVLVDGGSASASEIVAGAIQDLEVGKLLGTQTFGKASVQTVYRLSNGGALKLTTAKYLTPKEREINDVGLTPDYVVEDPEAQLSQAVEILKVEIQKLPQREVVQISLILNNNQAKIGDKAVALDASPYLTKGRTMVPLRFIAEAFGGNVGWDEAEQTINIIAGGKQFSLQPGKSIAKVSGQEVRLDAPAQLLKGRAYVPLRFVAETLGAKVDFNYATDEITIAK